MLRVMGKKYALLTFAGDLLKGIVAVLIGKAWLGTQAGEIVGAFGAILGHNFPLYFGFKGGKGIATSFGCLLIVFPVQTLCAFGVFLLMQFMEAIPNEIIESCRIDGAKEVTLFFRLILPMVKPAWLTVVIFTFTSVWNTNGVQFIYSESRKMLPAMLSQLSGAGVARAGVASAVAVLLLIPPVVIFLFSQKSVVETMAHSGLKG